jgi:hypothetical protein
MNEGIQVGEILSTPRPGLPLRPDFFASGRNQAVPRLSVSNHRVPPSHTNGYLL